MQRRELHSPLLLSFTNHPDRLDQDLSRPGCFDVRIAFFDAIPDQATALLKHFYPVEDSYDEKSIGSQTEFDQRAQSFADAVFKTTDTSLEVSITALQGYLLEHKNSPRSAANGAGMWVEGVLEQQEERVNQRQAKVLGR